MTRWIRFFGNLDGRIARKTFWLASLAIVAAEIVAMFVAGFLVIALTLADRNIKSMIVPAILAVTVPFLYAKFVIAVKRAHDRNIPLWIIAGLYAAAIAREVLIYFGWLQRHPWTQLFSTKGFVSFVITILVGVVGLALLVELGFRKGKPGPNRFGPDPLMRA